MAKVSWVKQKQGIEMNLQAMVTRGKSVSTYLNRTLFRQFQQAQLDRWETENASQGSKWEALTPAYAKRKRIQFAAYPGAGNVIMTATGKLMQGAQAKNTSYYFKSVTDRNFTIGINTSSVPYAAYPGVMRPYMAFTTETIRKWTKGLADYVMTGRGMV